MSNIKPSEWLQRSSFFERNPMTGELMQDSTGQWIVSKPWFSTISDLIKRSGDVPTNIETARDEAVLLMIALSPRRKP
jgi:hypothetical protein